LIQTCARVSGPQPTLRAFTALALLLMMTSLAVFAGPPRPRKTVVISMVPLLANPQKFNHKTIETHGFLDLGSRFDSRRLWLHERDVEGHLFKNSIQLVLSAEEYLRYRHLHRTYVMIGGQFHSTGWDSNPISSGTLSPVTLLARWGSHPPPTPEAPEN
jgi:hypothetical protein